MASASRTSIEPFIVGEKSFLIVGSLVFEISPLLGEIVFRKLIVYILFDCCLRWLGVLDVEEMIFGCFVRICMGTFYPDFVGGVTLLLKDQV